MTTKPTPSPNAARLERTYDAPAELVWELCTTAAGLEGWWGAEGFATQVSEVDLRPSGHVRYRMTATAPEQVAFVRNLGLPLSNEFCRTFTEVVAPTRLGYRSLIDFVPDQKPYEHLTVIDFEPAGEGTKMVVTIDPLHDEAWTEQYRDHRNQELSRLQAVISRRVLLATPSRWTAFRR